MLRMMMTNRFDMSCFYQKLSESISLKVINIGPLLWQAIASMMRAQEADPTNLEVLLALGVSHTNGIYIYIVS